MEIAKLDDFNMFETDLLLLLVDAWVLTSNDGQGEGRDLRLV